MKYVTRRRVTSVCGLCVQVVGSFALDKPWSGLYGFTHSTDLMDRIPGCIGSIRESIDATVALNETSRFLLSVVPASIDRSMAYDIG